MTGGLSSQWDPRTVGASLIPAAAPSVGGVLSWFSISRSRAGKAGGCASDQVRGPSPRGSRAGGLTGRVRFGGHRDAPEDVALGFPLAIVGLSLADRAVRE